MHFSFRWNTLCAKVYSLWKKLSDNLPYLWLFAMIAGLISVAISFAVAGEKLPEGFLYVDTHDVGMDHFNSVMATGEKLPYTKQHITYPPLAAMFYYFFFRILSPNVTAGLVENFPHVAPFAIRDYQTGMLPYLVYVILCCVLITSLLHKKLTLPYGKKMAVILATFLSIGFLSVLDRGNNVLLVTLLLLYYVFYYDSDNKFLAETALFALALATGLKLYPIVFGVLLIRRHKIWKGFRALGYIFLSLVLPFFFFEGLEGLKLWLTWLFPEEKIIPLHPGALNFVSIIYNIEAALGINLPEWFSSIFPILFIGLGILFAITVKKNYKALVFCLLAIVGFAGVTFEYFLFFSIIPLAFLCMKCNTVRDRIWAIFLVAINIPLCLQTPARLVGTGVCLPDVIESFLLLGMFFYYLIDGGIDFVGYIKNARWRYLFRTEKQMARMKYIPTWEE